MTAEKETEWAVVPREPTREMMLAGYYPDFKYDKRQECYGAMLAAAPDSGMVAVEANDLESVVILAMGRPSLSPLDEELLARLRALLSRAGNEGDGR